ncbi:MAG: hypothetical protein ACNA8L_13830 [Luteolibacter sp.]
MESITPYLHAHGSYMISCIYSLCLLGVISIYLFLDRKNQDSLLSVSIIFITVSFVLETSSFMFISSFKFVISGDDTQGLTWLERSNKISSFMSYAGFSMLALYAIVKFHLARRHKIPDA